MEKTKKCVACKTDIPFKAIKCPNCRSTQPTKLLGFILLGLIVIGIIIGIVVAISPDSRTRTQSKLNSPEVSAHWAEVYDAISGWQKLGMIKKIDSASQKAYVSSVLWNDLNIEQKKNLATVIAYYMTKEGNGEVIWADIYDWQSGIHLAKYSDAGGFSIE